MILPDPVDKIVATFIEKIVRVDHAFIEGIYLIGSIALNDFHVNKSDIDFLVLCKKLPDLKIAAQLKAIHLAIEKQFPFPNLGGNYLSSGSISTLSSDNIPVLTYHESKIHFGNFEMAPVCLMELKMNAITVYGRDAHSLEINISPKVLNEFLNHNINSYWKNWIDKHSSYLKQKTLLILFPRLTEWSVLGVARQLCTLQTGRIVSKTEAGHYCLEHLPVRFHSIIRGALRIRSDERSIPHLRSYLIKPSLRRANQTIECVHYIIELFNNLFLK